MTLGALGIDIDIVLGSDIQVFMTYDKSMNQAMKMMTNEKVAHSQLINANMLTAICLDAKPKAVSVCGNHWQIYVL